jgi:hypothetical protein
MHLSSETKWAGSRFSETKLGTLRHRRNRQDLHYSIEQRRQRRTSAGAVTFVMSVLQAASGAGSTETYIICKPLAHIRVYWSILADKYLDF